MKPELKKLLILNAPYLLFVYLFDKIGQAVRLSPGTDLSGKVNVKKLYSPKTGKTYDGTIVLADTGGKYVNYRVELPKKK